MDQGLTTGLPQIRSGRGSPHGTALAVRVIVAAPTIGTDMRTADCPPCTVFVSLSLPSTPTVNVAAQSVPASSPASATYA